MLIETRERALQKLKDSSTLILSLVFLVVAGLGMYNHELWRDEYEIFMTVRDATGIPGPTFYYALLYPLIKTFPSPIVFQMFHLLIIFLAVFIFNRYSPFTYIQKIFFSFSYFVLFEYGVISRDYSMLLLFLFLALYLITRPKQNVIAIAVSLILLANHHLYGVFFGFSLFIYEVLYITGRAKTMTLREKRRLMIAGALMLTGCFLIPLQYYTFAGANRWALLFGKAPFFMTLRSVWNAFVPITETAGIRFWNTNILPFPELYSKNAVAASFITPGNILAAAVSIFILFAGIIIFSKKLPVLITFLTNTALQLAFLQVLSVFYVRYQGPLLMIFLYNYWLLAHDNGTLNWNLSRRISDFFQGKFFISARKFTPPFVTLILVIQFCAGIFCYIQDIRYPFTASYETARYIKEENLDNNIIVGYIDYAVQSISGLLDQEIYYPQSGAFGTHVQWSNKERRESISLEEVLGSALRMSQDNGRDVLLILNFPLRDGRNNPIKNIRFNDGIKLIYLREFTQTIVPDEIYFLYLFQKIPR